MREIKLTRNQVALVDDEDFDWLNRFKWHAGRDGNGFYAKRHITSNTIETMQEKLLNPPHGRIIDHIDGNKLNNQKSNLRLCTKMQNCQNRIGWNKKSLYKGVKKHQSGGYEARIGVNWKNIYLGYFKTPKEAALAYNKAALKYHGKFARLNVIDDE